MTSAEVSKNEHYNAKDQTVAEYNKGKYAYIHTEKSRAVWSACADLIGWKSPTIIQEYMIYQNAIDVSWQWTTTHR